MVGLAVFGGIALYVTLCWLIVRAFKRKWQKVLVAVTAAAFPFWDVPFGYYSYSKSCTSDAHLTVSTRFPPTTAVLLAPNLGYHPEQVFRLGFDVVEFGEPPAITRYVKREGSLLKRTDEKAISAVEVSYVPNQALPWNLLRTDFVATKRADNQVIARYSTFRWQPTWWLRAAAPLLGYGFSCGHRETDSILHALAKGWR